LSENKTKKNKTAEEREKIGKITKEEGNNRFYYHEKQGEAVEPRDK